MNAERTNLRSLLSEITKTVNFDDVELVKQANAVDFGKLEPRIARMVTRAAIIAHAFDVMRDGTHKHPLAAFVHATECDACVFEPLSDSEYFYLLETWAKLCEVKPTIFTGGFVD